jgi:hypothetical protein
LSAAASFNFVYALVLLRTVRSIDEVAYRISASPEP